MIAALADWRRFVPAGARRSFDLFGSESSTGAAHDRRTSAIFGASRRSIRTGGSAGHADRPRLRRAVRRLSCGRHQGTRPRDRRAGLHERPLGAASSRSRSSWRPRATRRPRSSAISRMLRTFPTTRSTAGSSRRRSSSSTTCAQLSRRCIESSRRAACCSQPCPGLTKISRLEDEQFGEWWHYTGRSVRRLAEEAFGAGNVEVATYGNVLAASGFLDGLAASDLESGRSSTRTIRCTRS